MTLRLSREEGILVRAAAGRCAAPVDGTGRPPSWPRLLELARWHRLLPLLADEVLTGRAATPAPPAAEAELRSALRDSTARNLRLAMERGRIAAVLAQAGIPVMALKGTALAEAVYPQPGLRPMVDLDLLVPERSIRAAHRLVEQELGFAVMGVRLGRDDDQRLAESQHHFPLISADGAVMVELHHRLLDDRPAYEVEGQWARAVPADGPPGLLRQAPEDLFLHVAAHFTFDRIHRGESALGQLADVVRIAGRWTLDWDAVAQRARAAQVADRLFLALDTAARLAGDVAPADVTRALAPRSYTPARGERFVRQRVLRSGPALPLEQLTQGRERLVARDETLERYVRPGDAAVPSRIRLRARRWRALSVRIAREAPGPRALVEDIRLSRWMVSLRR